MSRIYVAEEHEFEAQHGLPESLPRDERLLWQGSPDWQSLAVNAFRLRMLTAYFAVLLVLRGSFSLADGASPAAAISSALTLLPLALIALGLVSLLAWLSARTAVYTITNKRVVMRIGVVLSVTFNLPFKAIESAALRQFADGSGDLPLSLAGEDRIAYLHLWPHARPWRFARPEPMLRAIPDAARVAALLSQSLAEAAGVPAGATAVHARVAPAARREPATGFAATA